MSGLDAIKRLKAARDMALAPDVCLAIYRSDPLPIGWAPPWKVGPIGSGSYERNIARAEWSMLEWFGPHG